MRREASSREDGFSLVEALVVLAISSVLLVTLTGMIGLTREHNQRLAEHSEMTGSRLYIDLQLQSVLDRLYIDPLLQPEGFMLSRNDSRAGFYNERDWREREQSRPPAFRGTPERFEFSARFMEGRQQAIRPVSVYWNEEADGRRMAMTLDNQTVVWPVVYDPAVRFAYLNEDEALVQTYPAPSTDNEAVRQTDAIFVPKAVMAYREDTAEVVFVLDVP
jgi:prepilin-type N-terminal cleavage/methylation domain-containing protein